ncbi:helix-turn-helix domain-containing protein [Streptomyces xanthophaeus]|uniref:helix-turn-helix domain-containing protein n=1 Tax=Streptomyces xanthophaeus TaxID=67385 RepID=UPI003661A721
MFARARPRHPQCRWTVPSRRQTARGGEREPHRQKGRLRLASGLTRTQEAEHLLISQPKISHLENGRRAIKPRDVRDLCDLYGVTDRQVVDALLRQARESGCQDPRKTALRRRLHSLPGSGPAAGGVCPGLAAPRPGSGRGSARSLVSSARVRAFLAAWKAWRRPRLSSSTC